MKKKNEGDFTTIRVPKSILYRLKEFNARQSRIEKRSITLYETLDKITKPLEK